MKTTDELLKTHKQLQEALARNHILEEDKVEMERYIHELQDEIEDLLNQLEK